MYEQEEEFMCGTDRLSAFDSVLHSWIIKFVEMIGINNKIISSTKKTVSYWKTSMCLYAEEKLIATENNEIQCGIFQGDLLSPLLFCISFILLTEQMNTFNTEFEEHTTQTKILHLHCVDSLKVTVKTEDELQKQMQAEPSIMISM
jgi:hypothetical protein